MKEKILDLLKLLPVEYSTPLLSHNVDIIKTQLANAEKCLQVLELLVELPDLVTEIKHSQPITSIKYNADRFIFEIKTMTGLDSFDNIYNLNRSIEYIESEITDLKNLLVMSEIIKNTTCT